MSSGSLDLELPLGTVILGEIEDDLVREIGGEEDEDALWDELEVEAPLNGRKPMGRITPQSFESGVQRNTPLGFRSWSSAISR